VIQGFRNQEGLDEKAASLAERRRYDKLTRNFLVAALIAAIPVRGLD
jgi:uncharacterized protein with von Willebrand factor type A (vWA) domain